MSAGRAHDAAARRVDGPRAGATSTGAARRAGRPRPIDDDAARSDLAARSQRAARAAHRPPRAAGREHARRTTTARWSSTSASARSPRRRACRRSTGPSCSRRSPSLVGAERAVASAARVLGPDALVATCRTSSRWRCRPRPASRRRSRCSTTAHRRSRPRPARSAVPLERLVRVRPRTLLTIAALVGAFYVLLPQLANVDDSFGPRDANWGWLLRRSRACRC